MLSLFSTKPFQKPGSRLVKYTRTSREGRTRRKLLAPRLGPYNPRGSLTYLQELRMRVSLHLSGTRAQDVRDRFPTFWLVQLLHGTLVEQEDRDLLRANIRHFFANFFLHSRRNLSLELKRENRPDTKSYQLISFSRFNRSIAFRIDFSNWITSNPRSNRLSLCTSFSLFLCPVYTIVRVKIESRD